MTQRPALALAVAACGALTISPAAAQLLPDLTITRIDISPTNPAVGQPISVTVTARNDGEATPTEQTYVFAWYNSPTPPAGCDGFDAGLSLGGVSFPPGAERVFIFEAVVYNAPGTYRFHAWINCTGIIEESNMSNNQLYRDITVGSGDLTIMSIVPSVADPVPGQPLYINVTVGNSGPYIEQLWTCRVFYQQAEPTNCNSSDMQQFIGFPPNSTYVVSFGPVSYPSAGQYPVWAWVDCENNVPESNNNNNKGFGTIAIEQPDLIVESITLGDTTPDINQQIGVDVTVRNVGSADAGAFRLSLVPDSAAEPAGDGCALPQFVNSPPAGLPVNQSWTATFQVTYTEARSQRLWAWADSCGDQVTEAREDNNKLSLNINVSDPTLGWPDLVVERITPHVIQTDFWGDVVQFDVVVTNARGAGTGSFRVGDFALTDFPGTFPSGYGVIGNPGPSGGGSLGSLGNWNNCEWRTREVTSLAPGASATVYFWRRYYLAGRRTFTASADACGSPPNYTVAEASEQNNSLTVEFPVSGCDADRDHDGWCDDEDFCPDTPDLLNNDSDSDGVGDVCDDDDDNDGVLDANDCGPRNRFIYPGAPEDCTNGLDDDCDGQIDEGARDWYRDADGDGFGDPGNVASDCTAPAGYVGNADDCDDTRANVYPGANGPCDDGLDNDCDGAVDNEHPVWGRDADADGFTDPNDQIVDDDGVCDGQPAGYILASATPDPDDADFMVPEPVVADPPAVEFSTPQGQQVTRATLLLRRNGAEPYTFEVSISFGPESSEPWLTVDPGYGTAEDGGVSIQLTPINVDSLAHATYSATLSIKINGSWGIEVPVHMTVRDPILRVVHSGHGRGAAWATYYDNARGYSVPLGEYDTASGTFSFEAQVPLNEGAYLNDGYVGDCSVFQGFYLEDGRAVYYQDEGGSPVPVLIDRDTTIEARFVPSYFLCSSCGLILLTLSAVGLRFTRPRARS